MNNVDDRLRRAAAETRQLAEHRRPARLPVGQPRSRRGPLVLAAAFVIVIGLFGVLPLLLDTTADESPLGSAPPVTEAGGPSSTGAVESCSSDGYSRPADDPTLPTPVASSRGALITWALDCDVAALIERAGEDFLTDFGGGGAENLQEWEVEGMGQLGTVLTLFDMSYGVLEFENRSSIYVWPAAYAYESWDDIPADEVAELKALYTSEELDLMRDAGAYLGWRMGIDEEGQWMFLVAGD